jgi:hypothetical protein
MDIKLVPNEEEGGAMGTNVTNWVKQGVMVDLAGKI